MPCEFITSGKDKITVFYDSCMEGGGTWFGQDYLEVIRNRYPNQRFDKCYEWCSGPGFIGFALLDNGLCQNLCCSDIFEPAIERVNETKNFPPNNCADRVSAYATGSVGGLPEHEQFDLVVANPPHYLECPGDDNYQRIAVDINWQAHQDFFKHIKQHLTPDGVILLQENMAGSLKGIAEFEPFITSNGLEITDWFKSDKYFDSDGPTQIYYIEIRHTKN